MNIDDFKKEGIPWPNNIIGDGAPYVEAERIQRDQNGRVTTARFKTAAGATHDAMLFPNEKGTLVVGDAPATSRHEESTYRDAKWWVRWDHSPSELQNVVHQ